MSGGAPGNVTLEGVERALELVDLGEVQNAYSVLDRTHEDIVDSAANGRLPS